jgi:hypothetical protein
MEYRFLIFGNTISDYLLNKTFPRDIGNSDYLQFLKIIKDNGEDLIGGMYEDQLVLDQELVLKPVPAWVQEDTLLI